MDEDWEKTQDKVFTKWMNSCLARKYGASAPVVTNLSRDLSDGVVLWKLFAALEDEGLGAEVPLPHINMNPRTRIEALDNVNQVLDYMEAIGIRRLFLTPLQVVDGDHKMVLGLTWRLILKSQIAALNESTAQGVIGEEHKADSSAKQALLEWCRKRTLPFGVKTDNFSTDWKDGRAFLALLDSEKPELLDFRMVDPTRHEDNLRLAFALAEKEFGISPLLDVNDVLCAKPDERSVMTYVSAFAHRFDVANREKRVAEREEELERIAREKAEALQREADAEAAKTRALQEELERMKLEAQQRQEEEQRRIQEMEMRFQQQQEALNRQAEQLRLERENSNKAAMEAEALRQAQFQAEEESRRQALALEQERLRQEQERLAQMERDHLEAERIKQEQERLEAERLAQVERDAQEAQRIAAEEERARLQAQLPQIEKEFGEAANGFAAFVHQEMQKLRDPRLNLNTVTQMVHLGMPYGEKLLARVRAAADQAMKAGLTSNRYTQQSLPGLEDAWTRQKQATLAKYQELQVPPPNLPAVPFSASFQPFNIVRKKELMLLLDITASMNAPISKYNETPRLQIIQQAVKLILDRLAYAASRDRNRSGGLRTITFAGGNAQDIGELTPQNLGQKWGNIDFVGNTQIMPGWRLMQRAFQESHGRDPQKPVMLSLVITDGDALDIRDFERTLQQEPNAYVVVCLVGYGEEHDDALRKFGQIAHHNDRLKMIPIHKADDVSLIAGTVMSVIGDNVNKI